MRKVLIVIEGGAVQNVLKPAAVEVEIRDFDTDGMDGPNIRKSKDGDSYQRMLWPARKARTPKRKPDMQLKVDLSLLPSQRTSLYLAQSMLKGKVKESVLSDIDGVLEMLHCMEDAYDAATGKDDGLRSRIAKCRRDRFRRRKNG